ncbi:bacterioferritin-associated ferredoxin [Thalassotalea maritima]|uniref:bacterioferritin-associated ferredoxin n=1 Tax=Thalassotalea maritima TaxID=3242416 RepID=UPI003527D700
MTALFNIKVGNGMFVCICYAITENDIQQAVANGANSMQQLRSQLNVANQCGKCTQFAKQVLEQSITYDYELARQVA